VKDLKKSAAIQDEGLHPFATQDYWTATINAAYMENHVLELFIRVPGYSNMYGQLGDGSIWRTRTAPLTKDDIDAFFPCFCYSEMLEGHPVASLDQRSASPSRLESLMPLPPLSRPKKVSGFGAVQDAYPSNKESGKQWGENCASEMSENNVEGKERVPGSAYSGGTAVSLVSSNIPLASFQAASLERGKRITKGDLSYTVPLPSPCHGSQPLVEREGEGSSECQSSTPSRSFLHHGPQKDPVRICAVACGIHHTLLLTSKHQAVYGCGRGDAGQLGGARSVHVQASFRSVRLLFGLPIRSIAAAGHHSFVVLRTGRLLAFGENRTGQLGMGHRQNVQTPAAVSFLQEDTTTMPPPPPHCRAPVEGKPVSPPRLQDAKMFSSLRAAYGSYESTYYPMRVQRISAERAPHEPFVLHVWTSFCLTVIITADLTWMSCGLPISRSTCASSALASLPSRAQEEKKNMGRKRFDGYGALGRPLFCMEESFSFGPMAFSSAVAECIKSRGLLTSSLHGGGGEVGKADEVSAALFASPAARQRLECFCYPHATVVKIPPMRMTHSPQNSKKGLREDGAQSKTSLFVQSNVVEEIIKFKADAYTLQERNEHVLVEEPAVKVENPDPIGSPSLTSLSSQQIDAMRPTTRSPHQKEVARTEKARRIITPFRHRGVEVCLPDYSPAANSFILRGTTSSKPTEGGQRKKYGSSKRPQGEHDGIVFHLTSSASILPFSSFCFVL